MLYMNTLNLATPTCVWYAWLKAKRSHSRVMGGKKVDRIKKVVELKCSFYVSYQSTQGDTGSYRCSRHPHRCLHSCSCVQDNRQCSPHSSDLQILSKHKMIVVFRICTRSPFATIWFKNAIGKKVIFATGIQYVFFICSLEWAAWLRPLYTVRGKLVEPNAGRKVLWGRHKPSFCSMDLELVCLEGE